MKSPKSRKQQKETHAPFLELLVHRPISCNKFIFDENATTVDNMMVNGNT